MLNDSPNPSLSLFLYHERLDQSICKEMRFTLADVKINTAKEVICVDKSFTDLLSVYGGEILCLTAKFDYIKNTRSKIIQIFQPYHEVTHIFACAVCIVTVLGAE